MLSRCAAGFLLGLAVVPGPTRAQEVPPLVGVREGTRVRLWAPERFIGAVERLEAESIWVRDPTGRVSGHALREVRRIDESQGWRSGAGTGALVGLGMGAAVTGVFLAAFCGGDTVCGTEEVVRAGVILGAPCVILGAVLGSTGREEKWRRLEWPGVRGAARQEGTSDSWHFGLSVRF